MSRGLRIGILLSGRHIANRERMFFRVADHLAARGAEVTFLAAGPEPVLTAALGASGKLHNVSSLPVHLAGIPLPHGLRLLSSIRPLARYIRDCPLDILFATSVPPNLIALLASARSERPVRIVLRQSNTIGLRGGEFAGIERRWRDLLIPRLYPKADCVIANSDGVARNLAALGMPETRITAIPNGIDCAWIARQAQLPARLPPAAPGVKTIITVGRLVAQKDHATLIRAVAAMGSGVGCRLVILGSGPEKPALRALADNLGLAERVHFAGYQANPYSFLAQSDLFVLSSRYEGMPNVLLEALACGLPAVSTDCPSGPSEILADGAFGELVPVADPTALALAMTHALQAPPQPERQRWRARAYDVETIAARYADVILGSTVAEATLTHAAAE